MNAEELSKLVREYRPTMDKDILHSWASDIVAALSAAPSPAGEAIREAAAKIAEAAYAENSISRWAGDYIASLIRAMPIPAPVALPQAGEVEPELRLEWRDGPPPKPWSEEWFIALTIYGGRVVLRALPEEYTYDFTTADDTYMMAKNIKRWMQFPDSEYIAPDTGPPSSVIPAAAVGEDRPYGVGADYSVTALLIQTFERWLEMGPNAQPHYPGGNRPWSTGDLKWMIEQLSALPTPSEGLTERSKIVVWLRQRADRSRDYYCYTPLRAAADAIEAGEHAPEKDA